MLKELYDASYSLPSEGDWLNIDGVGTVPNNVCSRAAAEIERLRKALRQINARARAIPGDDLKELQRQMAHIESLSRT